MALHDGIKSTSSKITRLINNLPSSDFQEREIEVIAKYIQESESDNWKIFNLFNLLFKIHYEYRDAGDLAFECGKKLVSSGFNQADLMIKLASLMMYDGQFTEASNLLKGAEEHPSVTKKMAAIEARIKELDDSLKIVPNFSPQRKKNSESIETRVLYMLHNSLPYESGGYATRSHGLLCGVRQNGWDIQAVTRLAYPLDLTKHHGKSIPAKSELSVMHIADPTRPLYIS